MRKNTKLNGIVFLPDDKKLVSARNKTAKLLEDYNTMKADARLSSRDRILKKLFNNKVKGSNIARPFFCEFGTNIKIGKNFKCGVYCSIDDSVDVVFGNDCIVGQHCCFYTSTYASDISSRKKGLKVASPIVIGDNVVISDSVIVLGGVTIGRNAFIKTGSVVDTEIPEGATVSGNPCVVVLAETI
ncbi:MAG: maltose acetyltransferase domain-containing protein [Clostridia bacterium]